MAQNGDYRLNTTYDNSIRTINTNGYRNKYKQQQRDNEKRVNNSDNVDNNITQLSEMKETENNIWRWEDSNSNNNQNHTSSSTNKPLSSDTADEVTIQRQPPPISQHEQKRVEKEVRNRALNDIMSMLNLKIQHHTQLLSDMRIEEDLYRKEKDLQLAQAQYEQLSSSPSSSATAAIVPKIIEDAVLMNK